MVDKIQYDDVLRISMRSETMLHRSVIGETEVRIDRFFDYKPTTETFDLYSDVEHTVRGINETGLPLMGTTCLVFGSAPLGHELPLASPQPEEGLPAARSSLRE